MKKYDPMAWEKLGDKFTNNYEAGMLDYRANIIRTILQYQDQCENLLDIACADGWFVEQLRKNGFKKKYLGVDITPNLIDRAWQRMPHEEFYIGDARNLEHISDNEFDFILCAGLLMHLPLFDSGKVIQEACRSSKRFIMLSYYGTYDIEPYEVPDNQTNFINYVLPMNHATLFASDEFRLVEFHAFPRTKNFNMFQLLFMRADLP